MKKIEDYIKYYVGQYAIMVGDKTLIEGRHIELVKGGFITMKPILRPLSSLSKDELQHIAIELKAGTWNVGQLTTGYPWTTFRLTPDIVHYLLSRGFDLFNLIESGLAITEPVNEERK